MNELTQNIQKMMVPKAAIIAYKYEAHDKYLFGKRLG